jgi:hypothetical protein
VPPMGLMALQASAGNAAVVQMLRQAGHAWAQERHQHSAGCGHQQAGEAAPPVQRSTVHDVLRTPGQPLDGATRADMEARLGADFSDVRIHNDSAAKASAAEVGARAYTSGNHVIVGDGGADKHTLAHELTHVIQQRQGPVDGTDNGAGLKVSDPADRYEREAETNATRVMSNPRPTQRAVAAAIPTRNGCSSDGAIQRQLTPFATNVMTGTAPAYTGGTLDNLRFTGSTAGGATLGNSVSIEHLLSQTGGGSEPGYPWAFEQIRLIDAQLVWERSRSQAATAMHAVNGDFVAGANHRADNIFMGTAKANKNHLTEVEAPIRIAMRNNASGTAERYEQVMNSAVQVPGFPHLWGLNLPGQNIPGARVVSPQDLMQAGIQQQFTHVIDTSSLPAPLPSYPRILVYTVTPHYGAGLIDYLQNPNIVRARQAITEARQQLLSLSGAAQAELQEQIDNEEKAVNDLIQYGPSLFPVSFTSTAEYWLATFNPTQRWQVGSQAETLDAQV